MHMRVPPQCMQNRPRRYTSPHSGRPEGVTLHGNNRHITKLPTEEEAGAQTEGHLC